MEYVEQQAPKVIRFDLPRCVIRAGKLRWVETVMTEISPGVLAGISQVISSIVFKLKHQLLYWTLSTVSQTIGMQAV